MAWADALQIVWKDVGLLPAEDRYAGVDPVIAALDGEAREAAETWLAVVRFGADLIEDPDLWFARLPAGDVDGVAIGPALWPYTYAGLRDGSPMVRYADDGACCRLDETMAADLMGLTADLLLDFPLAAQALATDPRLASAIVEAAHAIGIWEA